MSNPDTVSTRAAARGLLATNAVRVALGVLLVLTCAVAVLPPPRDAQALPLLPTGFADDTLITGLQEPNSMAFLPDGRLLFTELKNGRVRMVVGDHVAEGDPVVTVDGLNNVGNERGLQGIAVDPRWPSPPYVYVAYTHVVGRTWLVRYTGAGDVDDPAGENLVLGEPLVLISDIRDAFENHNGLGLRFDTTDHLLFSLGEDSGACISQLVDSLGGKLLRLDVMRLPPGGGTSVPRGLLIPFDHPFAGPDSNAMLVHAMGLRNPWRFHVDPVEGTIALADVGQDQYEEVNVIAPGANYGWPIWEGDVPGPHTCTPQPPGPFTGPIVSLLNGVQSVAIHTAGFYRPVPGAPHNWPAEFWGDLFYGDYYHSRLRRLRYADGAWSPAPPATGQPNADDFATGLYWSADYAVGPDGSQWWLKAWDDSFNPTSGMVRRIRWTGPVVAVDAGTSALRATPNPFRDRVVIDLASGAAGPLDVTLFDVAGREVRRLVTPGGSGVTRVTWDGRDATGRDVPPGIYLARHSTAPDAEPGAVVRLLRVR